MWYQRGVQITTKQKPVRCGLSIDLHFHPILGAMLLCDLDDTVNDRHLRLIIFSRAHALKPRSAERLYILDVHGLLSEWKRLTPEFSCMADSRKHGRHVDLLAA